MSSEPQIKQQVREFYDQVGWQLVGEDVYQNARYEDLRPVAHDYIHRCHLRVARHLKPQGTYLLDAGSGPIQYPEYLEYSRSYQYRVCVDLSQTAIKGGSQANRRTWAVRCRRRRKSALQARLLRCRNLAAHDPPFARRRAPEGLPGALPGYG